MDVKLGHFKKITHVGGVREQNGYNIFGSKDPVLQVYPSLKFLRSGRDVEEISKEGIMTLPSIK